MPIVWQSVTLWIILVKSPNHREVRVERSYIFECGDPIGFLVPCRTVE